MMKLNRHFISVGHGGFSKETFLDENGSSLYTIVYDCGSKRKTEIVKKIDANTQEDETIDILFLSHFDDDHINGVEHLLCRCKVKTLMVPSYNMHVLLAEYIVSKIHKSTATSSLLKTIILGGAVGNKNTTTIYVPAEGDSVNGKCHSHKSGESFVEDAIPQWEFIPFNISFSNDEYKAFFDWFIEKYPDCINGKKPNLNQIDEVLTNPESVKKIKSEIKNLKNRNKHSMVLYSGPITLDPKTKHLAACLYMGDFEATPSGVREIINRLSSRWPFVHLVQVPHHGSKHNFTPNSGLYNNQVLGITFASESEFNYPDSAIVTEITQNGGISDKVSYSIYTEKTIII